MTFLKQLHHPKISFSKPLVGLALVGLLSGAAIGLEPLVGMEAIAKETKQIHTIKGDKHRMIVDQEAKELHITATVTKDCSKPGVCDFGRRFQAFFGTKGGKMEKFFVFTTDVPRSEINKAIQELGVVSRNQIPMEDVEKRRGLSASTKKDDYLQGDPIIATVRFKKDGKDMVMALEDLIEERINVNSQEVFKPYTPHFVYHGTAEAIHFPSGCVICPSGCNGGIIADNSVPLKHTVNYYRVNWNKMPPVGAEVEMVLKSIF